MTFGAIFGAQSDATRFVGCVSLIRQIPSFWLRPGVEIRRGQAVSGNFISGIWLWGTCKGRLGEPDGELSLPPLGEPGVRPYGACTLTTRVRTLEAKPSLGKTTTQRGQ